MENCCAISHRRPGIDLTSYCVCAADVYSRLYRYIAAPPHSATRFRSANETKSHRRYTSVVVFQALGYEAIPFVGGNGPLFSFLSFFRQQQQQYY